MLASLRQLARRLSNDDKVPNDNYIVLNDADIKTLKVEEPQVAQVIMTCTQDSGLDRTPQDGYRGSIRQRVVSCCRGEWNDLFERSTTNDTSGAPVVSTERTSSSMLVPLDCEELLIGSLVPDSISRSCIERLEIVRYLPGEMWKPHLSECLTPGDNSRQYAIQVFLNTVPPGMGGEVRFTCAGVKVEPRGGTTLTWRPTTRNNDTIPESLMEELPTLPGAPAKFVLLLWIRRQPINRQLPLR